MTLDEAIRHLEDIAEVNEKQAEADESPKFAFYSRAYRLRQYADEHRQLAEWLKELKQLREQTRWIPVSERPPEDGQKCLISIEEMVDTAIYSTNLYAVHEYDFCDKKNISGFYDYDGEYGYFQVYQVYDVEAWMPLPEPYKADKDGKE